DGLTGGSPNDTAPADYKLVQMRADCSQCLYFHTMELTSWVGPENLENATGNGSLFINVFDANGLPVEGADIEVENNSTSPTISISDESDVNGVLKLIDIATSTNAYEISVSKSGYTSARTYLLGDEDNPNPLQTHATVASGMITEISFAIDKASIINVQSYGDYFCTALASASFTQRGSKLIGSGPDVYKYDQSFSTNASGQSSRTGLDWDSYTFTNDSAASYDLVGSSPLTPLDIDPDSTLDIDFVLLSAANNALLIEVLDASSTPVTGATTTIEKDSTKVSKFSGVIEFGDSDWSGSNYSAQDGTINAAGQLTLSGPPYPTSTTAWLTSRTFDLGSSNTNFRDLFFLPGSSGQPGGTSAKLQIASNNDNASWNYLGPDGTASTYYTDSAAVSSDHDGKRYLRYQVFLSTGSEGSTPSVDDVYMTFDSDCVPSGYSYFANPGTGNWDITVSYGPSTVTSTINVTSGLNKATLTLP
ncbi:MAG: carboxypeptidase-like regulatory domain-containing protein, partial [Candidatus Harrisonbacteria bacterium]|nr:carboxypeptidase-like regulatory domain-containing protein [Candidatus Harrisonbacteria bacterium]